VTVRVEKKTHFVSVVSYPLRPHAASPGPVAARQRCEPFTRRRGGCPARPRQPLDPALVYYPAQLAKPRGSYACSGCAPTP
jgi:hypothetical protein